MKLSDIQNAINSGRFATDPEFDWIRNNDHLVYDPRTGEVSVGDPTALRRPQTGPMRSPHAHDRTYIHLIAIIAFLYAIYTDGPLRTFTVTTLLVLISLLVGTLIVGLILLARHAFPDTAFLPDPEPTLSTAVALFAALAAMLTLAFFQGEFPSFYLWIIELVIANFFEKRISRRLEREIKPHTPNRQPNPDRSMYLRVAKNTTKSRLFFALLCLTMTSVILYIPLYPILPAALLYTTLTATAILLVLLLRTHLTIVRANHSRPTYRLLANQLPYFWASLRPAKSWSNLPLLLLIYGPLTILAGSIIFVFLAPFAEQLCTWLC